jgi:hypothetical protein
MLNLFQKHSSGWDPDMLQVHRDDDERQWHRTILESLELYNATSYHGLPLKYRLLAFRNFIADATKTSYTPKNFKYLLSEDSQLVDREVKESVDQGVSMIHSIALRLGSASISGVREEWEALVREIITATGPDACHTIETVTINTRSCGLRTWMGTPLHSLFHGLEFCYGRMRGGWTRYLDGALHCWLTQLAASGIDLVEYGTRERGILTQIGWSLQVFFPVEYPISRDRYGRTVYGEPVDIPLNLIDLQIGPAPADWVMTWDIDTYTMVGDFLQAVEKSIEVEEPVEEITEATPPTMPGAWVD